MAGHGALSALSHASVPILAAKAIPMAFRYALKYPGEAAHAIASLFGIAQSGAKTIERGAQAFLSSRSKGTGRGEVVPGVGNVPRAAAVNGLLLSERIAVVKLPELTRAPTLIPNCFSMLR